MLVAPMRSHEERMTVLIMQQEKRSAAQDHPQTPDQSTREKHVTVNRFAMTVHITGQRVELLSSLSFSGRMPEMCGSARESISVAFGTTSRSHL